MEKKEKVNRRSDEFKSVFGNAGKGDEGTTSLADWRNASPASIARLVVIATSRGGAVRFGYSRDANAYAIGLYYGAEHVTKYCRPSDDIEDFLKTWTAFFDNLPDTNGVSPQ